MLQLKILFQILIHNFFNTISKINFPIYLQDKIFEIRYNFDDTVPDEEWDKIKDQIKKNLMINYLKLIKNPSSDLLYYGVIMMIVAEIAK